MILAWRGFSVQVAGEIHPQKVWHELPLVSAFNSEVDRKQTLREKENAMNRMTALVSEQEGPKEDWQAKVAHLEEWVCDLLMTNQTLRMALQAERARIEDHGHSYDPFAIPSIG
jgi:hypothetical protein